MFLTAANVNWVDGPWLGILRPYGDNRWVLPSTRTETADADLNKRKHLHGSIVPYCHFFFSVVEDIALGSSHDCAGIDRRGQNFGFWRCRNGGSPWCEIDLPPSPVFPSETTTMVFMEA